MAINTHDFPAIGEWVAPDLDTDVHVGLVRWERGKNISLEFTSIFPTMTTNSRPGGLQLPLATGEVNFLGDCSLLSLQEGGMKLGNNGSIYEWQAEIGLIGKKLVSADEKFIRYAELASKDLLRVLNPPRDFAKRVDESYVIDLSALTMTWNNSQIELTVESSFEGTTNYKTFDINFHRPMIVKICFVEPYTVDELMKDVVLPLKNLFETIDLEPFSFESLKVWDKAKVSSETPEDALAKANSSFEIIGDFLSGRNENEANEISSDSRYAWNGPRLEESMDLINSLPEFKQNSLVSGIWYFLRAKSAGIPLDSRLSYLFGLIDSYYYSLYPPSELKEKKHKTARRKIVKLLSRDEISQVFDEDQKVFISEYLLNKPRRPTYEQILLMLASRMGIKTNFIWEVTWKARGINPGSDWRLMYKKLHDLRNHIQHGGKTDLNTAKTAEECLIQFIRLLLLHESGLVDKKFCITVAGNPPTK